MSTLDPAQPTPAEQLWDANDVARYLKVSRSWVYHRAESGELPSFRVGGLRRFDPQAIQSFARGETKHGARVVPFRGK
jgi:excisionase family DNA binding protein